jgi:hypothetical protein
MRDHRSSLRAYVMRVYSCRRANAPAGSAAPTTRRPHCDGNDEFARAVRLMGEPLKQFDGNGNNQHGAGDRPSQTQAATKAGLSRHQRKQAVRVANVPAAEFEAAIESQDRPPSRRSPRRPAILMLRWKRVRSIVGI